MREATQAMARGPPQPPLKYPEFELQFLRPCIDLWTLPVAACAIAVFCTAGEGGLLYLLQTVLVLAVAVMLRVNNRRGNTKKVRLLFKIHGLCRMMYNVMWMIGAAKPQPIVLQGDFCLHLFCLPFEHVIGNADVPRSVSAAYLVAHALFLGAFHMTVGGRSFPSAIGRGAGVQLLSLLAGTALQWKCAAVYTTYLRQYDATTARSAKQGGTTEQQRPSKDLMVPVDPVAEQQQQQQSKDKAVPDASLTEQQHQTRDSVVPEHMLGGSALTIEAEATSLPATKPDTGTQPNPPGALLQPHHSFRTSSASAADSTPVLEGSTRLCRPAYHSRFCRRQVQIRIEAQSGTELNLLQPGLASELSRRLNNELPDCVASEPAIRVGCIIISFELASLEGASAQGPGLQALPCRQTSTQLAPASAQAKLLSLTQGVLQEYGPKLGLPHGTEISVQIDGCTVFCKWDAEDREWITDSITASATAAGVASKAGMCQFRLHSPVLQIPSLAAEQPAKCQQAGLQQLDQPDHAGQSAPLLVAASLRGEHAGGRVVQGWGAAAQREELNTAATPAPGSMTAGDGLALQLVARTQGCFLPVVMAHQSPVRPDEQLMEAHVLLPPCLAHASDPFALELELWAQDVCLSSHPALAVPSHLTCLAQEMSAWAAAVNQFHPSNGSPSDDFVRDVADFLAFCKERKHCHQSQAEAMEAIGRDLLQFAINTDMEALAAHLRHKFDSSLSLDPDSNESVASSNSSRSSSSSEPGAANEGTAAATAPGQLGHRHLPLAYGNFEYQLLKPCLTYWALLVAISAITVFCTSEGGAFLYILSFTILLVTSIMVAFNRAGNEKMVRLLLRTHGLCLLAFYVMLSTGAATAVPVMLRAPCGFSMRLFCIPFHLIIGMAPEVPVSLSVANVYVLAQAVALGAFHVFVGGTSWPAALGRGAGMQLLSIIACVALKQRCRALYAAYLNRHNTKHGWPQCYTTGTTSRAQQEKYMRFGACNVARKVVRASLH